jgi:hypothetical protein
MITNTGKEIIGKYLVEQTDSYASHLAIGCGPKPLAIATAFGDYSKKTSLEFETLRVPIISKSLVSDSGLTRVVLTAELPTEERYEITEVGVYPAASNPIPTGLDTRPIVLFDGEELWKSHPSAGDIVSVPLQLESIADDENNITIDDKVFYTNSNNSLFEKANYPDRVEKHERPRFLDRTIFVRGNSSSLTVSGSDLTVSSGDHIDLAITPVDLARNSTEDELRLAFSVVNRNGTEIGETRNVPNNVKILIQFADTDGADPKYASFVVNLDNGAYLNTVGTQTPTGTTNITISTATSHNVAVGNKVTLSGITPSAYNGTWTAQSGTTGSTLILDIGNNPGPITDGGEVRNENKYDFSNNRYVVANRKIKELYKTAGFSWDKVTTVKVFVSITATSPLSGADFYVALDALKLENISSFSNVYGLTAYTVMKTSDSLAIVKSDNTSSFIEFSYLVDVL